MTTFFRENLGKQFVRIITLTPRAASGNEGTVDQESESPKIVGSLSYQVPILRQSYKCWFTHMCNYKYL
jgi:hypothetical protein